MDYLQTDALSVGYNGKTLISKVALSVQRGRIVTLIGPNGSGKSTILKTIIGQLPSISGSVFLDGAAGHELGVHAGRHQDGHAAGDVAPAAAAHVRAVEED